MKSNLQATTYIFFVRLVYIVLFMCLVYGKLFIFIQLLLVGFCHIFCWLSSKEECKSNLRSKHWTCKIIENYLCNRFLASWSSTSIPRSLKALISSSKSILPVYITKITCKNYESPTKQMVIIWTTIHKSKLHSVFSSIFWKCKTGTASVTRDYSSGTECREQLLNATSLYIKNVPGLPMVSSWLSWLGYRTRFCALRNVNNSSPSYPFIQSLGM